tara:strand:- start:18 stop:146 length:129 start_codon:yes stop_codon:yes gene_type:complete
MYGELARLIARIIRIQTFVISTTFLENQPDVNFKKRFHAVSD